MLPKTISACFTHRDTCRPIFSGLDVFSLSLELLHHVFLLALAGALLLTPGFLTDAFGFSLLLPGVRDIMAQSIMKRFKPQVMNPFDQQGAQDPFQQRHESQRPRDGRGDVIEGDYKREE